MKINQFSSGCGALISNIQLAQATDEELKAIDQAGIDHGVIFFRDQNLSPEAHLRLAQRMGTIVTNKFFTPVAEHPLIAEVRKDADQQMNIGGGWHTDHSYDQIPALGSILIARETPPVGGDTLFSCMYKAYDSLSDGMKKTLENLKAVHSSRHIFGEQSSYQEAMSDRLSNAEAATQDAVHPIVITHPESGRKALYVNPAFTLHIEGWTDAESKPLLDYLYQHAVQMEHTTRFKWAVGSIAFWDNRCTWHYALNDYHGERREMHRITIEGSPLAA